MLGGVSFNRNGKDSLKLATPILADKGEYMKTIQRDLNDTPWTEEEAQSYANAHGLTVIAINGRTLVVT